jgi:hypothetical protein
MAASLGFEPRLPPHGVALGWECLLSWILFCRCHCAPHGMRSARQFRARERGEAATLAELLGSRNAAEVRDLLPESEKQRRGGQWAGPLGRYPFPRARVESSQEWFRPRKVTWERRVFSRAGGSPLPVTPPGGATRSTRARPLAPRARARNCRAERTDCSKLKRFTAWRLFVSRGNPHHSLKSPLCSCVLITLPAAS